MMMKSIRIKGTTNQDAAREAELAVLTVPLHAQILTLKGVKMNFRVK